MKLQNHPVNDFDTGYHRMTLRYAMSYHRYLEALSFKSRLDISQLIRLMIHLSPQNEQFNEIVDNYVRPDRQNFIMIPQWDNPNMWKRC